MLAGGIVNHSTIAEGGRIPDPGRRRLPTWLVPQERRVIR